MALQPLDCYCALVFLFGEVLDADATDADHRDLDGVYDGEGDKADDEDGRGQFGAQAADMNRVLLRREDRQAN